MLVLSHDWNVHILKVFTLESSTCVSMLISVVMVQLKFLSTKQNKIYITQIQLQFCFITNREVSLTFSWAQETGLWLTGCEAGYELVAD